METTARLEGDFWILNGTKSWVTSGIEADVCCLFATIDKSLGHKGITGLPIIIIGKRIILFNFLKTF